MNINMLLWWSLGRGNTVVPSRWRATACFLRRWAMPKTESKQQLAVRGEDLACAELERCQDDHR
jgi:hypothetical protein